jgi:gluconokinase
MGVAGCGKSSVGAAVAQALGWPLIEGDDFHAPASMAKMRAGVPLTDADRLGWLDTLGAELRARPGGAVLTCSALRRAYRDRLRAAAPGLGFVHLVLSREAALDRVAQRFGTHPFPPSLVDSQFATLESPAGEPAVLELDATLPIAQLGDRVTAWLRADASPDQGPQA